MQLIDEGIDSYIQRHYKDKNDKIWYRVRVGNFDNKNKAIEIQKKLEKITGKKSWLDIILKKYKCVIQIQGCYWHKHNCKLSNIILCAFKERQNPLPKNSVSIEHKYV